MKNMVLFCNMMELFSEKLEYLAQNSHLKQMEEEPRTNPMKHLASVSALHFEKKVI